MLVAVLLPLAVFGAELPVDPLVGVVVVATSPKGVAPLLSSDAVFGAAEAALVDGTPLRIVAPEQAGVDVARVFECPLATRLSCWARVVHEAMPEERPLLVVVSSLADPPTIQAIALDVSEAVEVGATAEEEEDRRFAKAITAPTSTNERALTEHLAEAFSALRARRSDLARRARIVIQNTARGDEITVDGRRIGVSGDGETTLAGMQPGTRTVRITRPGLGSYDEAVLLTPGAVHRMPLVIPTTADASHPWHLRSAWIGVGTAALGAVVIGAAAATGAQPQVLDTSDPGHSAFARTCLWTGDVGCTGGVALLPLGVALMAAGGAAAATYGLVAKDPSYEWWWSLTAGLLGAAVYATMVIAE